MIPQSPVKIWRNQKNITDLVSLEGVIVTYTYIRVPQEGFSDQAPYVVAIVKLDNGTRVTVQITDPKDNTDVKRGQRVKLVVRRVTETDADGVIPYGIKGVLREK